VFDQNWAVVLMDRALEPYLTADSGQDGYAEVCKSIGLTSQAFAVAVHRFRKRFRHCVRVQVEMTVSDPAKVDAEMKHLFGI
jgi:hypothetical protein